VNFTGHNWIQYGDALNLQMFVWIIAATLEKMLQSKEMENTKKKAHL
jgi:hypothetical protein